MDADVKSEAVSSRVFDSSVGADNRVSIDVSNDGGAVLELNGEFVLRVPGRFGLHRSGFSFVPISSHMEVCVNLIAHEFEDYSIDFKGFSATSVHTRAYYWPSILDWLTPTPTIR